MSLEQTGNYPEDGAGEFGCTASRPAAFTLYLRVPAWGADGAALRVNGQAVAPALRKGFAQVQRTWRTGDRVTLTLPMRLRLETLPANELLPHPETVALLWGPLVLFALREPGDVGPLTCTAEALLGAERTGPREWRTQTQPGSRRLVPFTEVGEGEYSTYLNLA